MNVAIVYWGQKGGGPRQALSLASVAKTDEQNVVFFLSTSNELINQISETGIEIVQTSIPKNRIKSLFSMKSRKATVRETMETLKKMGIQRVFFLLPHPWDISLARRIRKTTNIEVWRAIHDARRHPGDMWPTSLTIRKMIKFCNKIITYSEFVSNQLENTTKSVMITHIYEKEPEPKANFDRGSVLFLGRIRKYKGLDLLAKAWPLVLQPVKKLTIAGEGNLPKEILGKADIIVNRWLSNEEIVELIRRSQLVVLPYVEASQSGIIPLATSLSTPVVVTPVGGLTEQVEDGVNGLVARSLSHHDFAKAISDALNGQWNFEEKENSTSQFLKLLTKPL